MPLAPAFLEHYSHSIRWSERYAVARNPHTPAAVLRRLAEIDGNRYVRAAARAGLAGG